MYHDLKLKYNSNLKQYDNSQYVQNSAEEEHEPIPKPSFEKHNQGVIYLFGHTLL
jgi:hypothetical protein